MLLTKNQDTFKQNQNQPPNIFYQAIIKKRSLSNAEPNALSKRFEELAKTWDIWAKNKEKSKNKTKCWVNHEYLCIFV